MQRFSARFLAFVIAFAALPCDARIYHGDPDLALTAAVVQAGGGPEHFDTVKLLTALAGDALPDELAVLSKRHGDDAVKDFPTTFNFLINDTLKAATAAGIQLPAPVPAPTDRDALVAAVWKAGLDNDKWDVGIMLERMISHPIHHTIMVDADAEPTVGPQRNAMAHILLTEMMHDLAVAHHLAKS